MGGRVVSGDANPTLIVAAGNDQITETAGQHVHTVTKSDFAKDLAEQVLAASCARSDPIRDQ